MGHVYMVMNAVRNCRDCSEYSDIIFRQLEYFFILL